MKKTIQKKEQQRKFGAWRLGQIDELLQSGKSFTAGHIAKRLEVSLRTIQRDIEYMRDFYNAPIEAGKDGYRYTEQNFFIKSIPMSEGEAFSLSVLNPLLEQYRNTPLEKDLRSIFKKIVECLPEKVTIDTSFLNSKITFIPDKAEIIEKNLFQTVFSALKSCRPLTFEYRPLQKNTYMTRTIEPYHVVCQKGNWYVIGLCRDKGDVRIFSLGRMKNVRTESKKFIFPTDFNPHDYFDEDMGVWLSNKTPLSVELLVDKEIGTYALNRFWHKGQTVEEREDGSVYVKFETTQKQEVLRWVLGQGHTVRVLAPQELVDEVRAECAKVAAMYGDLGRGAV